MFQGDQKPPYRGDVMPEPYELSVAEAASQIRQGTLSPVALAESLLARIDALDGDLRAWVTIDRGAVMATARQREADVQSGAASRPHPRGARRAEGHLLYRRNADRLRVQGLF